MNRMQAQVREFHAKLGQPIGTEPRWSREELRAKLILEEAIETVVGLVGSFRADDLISSSLRAHSLKDASIANMADAIDGMCDLIYVVLGTAVEMGIDLEPFFDEVHRSNMAKVGGPVRGDGKVLKPEGWQPPQIDKMLRELTNRLAKPSAM